MLHIQCDMTDMQSISYEEEETGLHTQRVVRLMCNLNHARGKRS